MEVKKAIVKYDVIVGKYDDFPQFTDEQKNQKSRVEKAALELFNSLTVNRDIGLKDINLEVLSNIIDLAADNLACNGFATYYPEYRPTYSAGEEGSKRTRTKVRCIQNYYNQYDFDYNEKGEVLNYDIKF